MPRAAKNRKTGLTQNQDNFCILYVCGPQGVAGNATECVRRSFNFKKAKNSTLQRRAKDFLDMGTIQARIEILRQNVADRAEITAAETMSIVAAIARVKLSDFYNEDGSIKSPHEWTEEMKIGAASLETLEEFEGQGKGRELIGYIKKFKLWDKNSAADKLMKHFGLYEIDNKQKSDPIRELLAAINGHGSSKLSPARGCGP